MRALLISPNPGGNAGGVERFCTSIAGVLHAAGWSTTMIGPAPVGRRLARTGLEPSLQAVSVTRGMRSHPTDLVISNGFLGGPSRAPRIHVFHGTMVRHVAAGVLGSRRYRLRQALGGGFAEALCGRGATTVAVSTSTADEVRRLYHQRIDAVIPNGVDTELFRPGDRGAARARLGLGADLRLALFVGRFEYRKGADLVPEACRRAGFALAVAGTGAPADSLALGTLSPAQLADAYRASDCVVFPTRYEACSFVVQEALASGIPLITTAVGWMPEFLARCRPYTRFVVSPEVDSVTAALERLGDRQDVEVCALARAVVCAEASLETFGRRWLELINASVAA